MDVRLSPGVLRGTTPAVPSKSACHRLAICGALARGTSKIAVSGTSEDMEATLGAISALGGTVRRGKTHLELTGIRPTGEPVTVFCGESGSTLRFLIPVAAALGISASFTGAGRLGERPLAPYVAALEAHGVMVDYAGNLPFSVSGRLTAGRYAIPGNISSQFITGLLFALPLLDGDSEIVLTLPLASKPYVTMTLDALRTFGVTVRETETGYFVPGNQSYCPCTADCEGDWSNSAFFLCAGALGGEVTCTGLRQDSMQGDREILNILRGFGASVTERADSVTVSPPKDGILHAVDVDCSQIPDLVPVLCAVAACAEGASRFTRVGRLRLKESDRLAAIGAMLSRLGVAVRVGEDTLSVTGGKIRGGTVSSCRDHRMAMTAAVLALRAEGEIILTGAECVSKSFPDFFTRYQQLGGTCHVIHVGE